MLEVSQVLFPVADIDASLHFYETVLGLEVALRDGERYATLKAGGVKAAAAFKVASLVAVIERVDAGGVRSLSRRSTTALTSAASKSRTPTATPSSSTSLREPGRPARSGRRPRPLRGGRRVRDRHDSPA
jgi:hypothetical protein